MNGVVSPGFYQLWIRCCRLSLIPSCGISSSSIISEIALYHSLKYSFVVSFNEICSVFDGKAKNKEVWDFWFVFCRRLPVTCKTRLSFGVSALFGENCFFVLFFSVFVLWKSNVEMQYRCEFFANNHILAPLLWSEFPAQSRATRCDSDCSLEHQPSLRYISVCDKTFFVPQECCHQQS